MGNKTVYISDENMETWEDFKTTYGSLNNYLSNSDVKSQIGMSAALTTSNYTPPTPVIVDKEVAKQLREVKPGKAVEVCAHGYSPKLCRFAKNGKPCKEKMTP